MQLIGSGAAIAGLFPQHQDSWGEVLRWGEVLYQTTTHGSLGDNLAQILNSAASHVAMPNPHEESGECNARKLVPMV